jgi:SAM-dependent methyltransferase
MRNNLKTEVETVGVTSSPQSRSGTTRALGSGHRRPAEELSKQATGEFYNKDFYSNQLQGTFKSAEIVLDLLYRQYRPRSVIDVGCGQGVWLAVAESLGATQLKGLDGEWVSGAMLLSPQIDYSPVNFEEKLPALDQKYDLCISLEVAEHLSEAKAQTFIDFLCNASDVVLFSAAIKHQGGRNHLNEQWQSYWIKLFQANGYTCLDILRPYLWDNPSVESWYRQNTFLFINPKNAPLDLEAARSLERPIWDIAHPKIFEHKVQLYRRQIQNPSLRSCLSCFKHYIAGKFRRSTT